MNCQQARSLIDYGNKLCRTPSRQAHHDSGEPDFALHSDKEVEKTVVQLKEHLTLCAACAAYQNEQNEVRGLLLTLDKIEAPANFAAQLSKRLGDRKPATFELQNLVNFAPGFGAISVAACFALSGCLLLLLHNLAQKSFDKASLPRAAAAAAAAQSEIRNDFASSDNATVKNQAVRNEAVTLSVANITVDKDAASVKSIVSSVTPFNRRQSENARQPAVTNGTRRMNKKIAPAASLAVVKHQALITKSIVKNNNDDLNNQENASLPSPLSRSNILSSQGSPIYFRRESRNANTTMKLGNENREGNAVAKEAETTTTTLNAAPANRPASAAANNNATIAASSRSHLINLLIASGARVSLINVNEKPTLQITAIVTDSNAAQSGLRVGDEILNLLIVPLTANQIDDNSSSNLRLNLQLSVQRQQSVQSFLIPLSGNE